MSLDVLQGRPNIENTPSGLRKITRFRKLNGEGAKSANISSYFDAYGTADVEFTTALLVEQRIERRSEGGEDVSLVKVYQELADDALTATTDVTETTTFDGRRVTRTLYLCKADDAASLRPAIGSGSPEVFQVEIEKSGPVAKLTTFAIEITDSGFVLSTSDDEKNNGKLLTRTIRTVGAAPATPSGYTLVSPSTQQIDGYTVYNYAFAKGLGEAGRDTDYFQSSDEGTMGGTRITITHFTAPATDTDPTSSPGAGYARASVKKSEADGYRVWVVVWAKGTGIVVTDVDTKNGGKLVVYHRVGFGAAPTTPDATLGGTVTATRTSVREADGIKIYDYEWAEGVGEISRETSTRLSGQLLRTTIRHLTALATGSQPTSDPHTSGSTVTEEGKTDQDGYRLWTVTWTKALSTAYIVDSTTKRNKGKLVLYRRERFGSAPSAPSATIAGTVVETDSSERLEDGYTVYVKEWAEGVGTITDDVTTRNQGKLIIYHKVALATAPSAPSATIGGTVVLTQDDSREESGVTIYDRTWAEGKGVVGKRTQPRDGGLRLETWESLGQAYDDSYMLPVGILMAQDHDDLDGVTRWTVTCMQKSDGTALDTDPTLEWQDYVDFTYPGRAQIFYKDSTYLSVARRAYDLFLEAPVRSLVMASLSVSYTTDPDALETLANPLWNPIGGATLFSNWVQAGTGAPKSRVKGLRGYRSVDDEEITVTADVFGGYNRCVLGNTIQPATSAYIRVVGGPEEPDGNTYTLKSKLEPAFTAFDGTQYFRKLIVEATIPAQADLPV